VFAWLQLLHSELMSQLDTKSPYTPLVRPASRPQPMKQLEPRITEKYAWQTCFITEK